jgi:hypothetical protein
MSRGKKPPEAIAVVTFTDRMPKELVAAEATPT